MTDNFNEKLNNLPLNVQDFLLSDYGKQVEVKIASKLPKIPGRLSSMGNIIIGLYFGELKLKDLSRKLKDTFKVDETNANKLACDILGKRVLVVKEFILKKYGEDLDGFIAILGGDSVDYDMAVNEFIQAVRNEKNGVVLNVEKKKSDKNIKDSLLNIEFDIKKEAKDTLEVFGSMFASILESDGGELLKEFNMTLLQLLDDYHNFGSRLETALYKNSEKITHKNFVLDKKAQAPSIKNWLRYFIEKQGSGMFNNLELTKFISESENAKKLDDHEKKVLAKLLRTYRNIKFFPQSMENLPPEQWEIIPLERKEVKSRASSIVHKKKSGRNALVDELKGNINDYAVGSLEREILEEESEKDREHHKLLLLAKKYPEGSLERRAVEDEIAKLEK